jgi:hypothetical protein
MQREYPSTPEEAFEAQITGCFFVNSTARHFKFNVKGHFGEIWKNKKTEELTFIPEDMLDRPGTLEIWRYPYYLHKEWDGMYWHQRYSIGADIAEGLGRDADGREHDYSVAYVYDRKTHEFVAKLRSNTIDSVAFAKKLLTLSKYYDYAFIVPERNGAGITTCKHLDDNKANVYRYMIPAEVGSGMTKMIGWFETRQAKYDLCGDLKEYLLHTKSRIYDKMLLSECGTFVKTETKKLEAAEGFFDDCVIAAGLAIQGNYILSDKTYPIQPEPTGWLKMVQDKRTGSAWARP